MAKYKVVVPTAGLGTRIGPYTKFKNKALVTVGNKPAIAHVINQFPIDVEIVVLTGYRGDQVKQTIKSFFPQRHIAFVEVDKFEGEGSGLGYSLRFGKHLLDCPFVFVSNDTLIGLDNDILDPSNVGNWAGFYRKQEGDGYQLDNYRTLNLVDGRVVDINPKGIDSNNIYIGLAGVLDYQEFWNLMDRDAATLSGESYALNGLKNIQAVEFKRWFDCGSLSQLEKANFHYAKENYNILEKENEAIWFHENKVIKFSADHNFISQRIKRTEYLPDEILPKITDTFENIYCYEKVDGEVLSDGMTPKKTIDLLNFAERKLWSNTSLDFAKDIREACVKFYRDKTFERSDAYHDRFEKIDIPQEINGLSIPSTRELLAATPWSDICADPHVSLFHGDFHNENILVTDDDKFIFLDWRQNFGEGNLIYGDAYYDIAKFLHGLMVNHSIASQGKFVVRKKSNSGIFLDILRPNTLVEAEVVFRTWLKNNGYDIAKVEILCALVFLNIAVLHEAPYSEFLFTLGRYSLAKVINAQ